MFAKSRRIQVITLLVVLLLMAVCTPSQAKPVGWSLYWWYDSSCPCWVLTIDWHWNTASSLSLQAFQFELQSDPTKTALESLEVLAPYGPNPPASNPDQGSGRWVVTGNFQDGTTPTLGEVDIARFEFTDILGTGGPPPAFTVSSGAAGYGLASDGTMYGPDDIDPASTVPEPSSLAALLTGCAGLVGFGIRRRTIG